MKFLSVLTVLACLACFTVACTEEQAPNPCNGVTCSGRGDCVNMGGKPFCRCVPPYKTSASGKECELACEDVTCAAHGSCVESDGKPLCICDAGYVATTDGKSCAKDGDPCVGVNCCGAGTCKVDGTGQPYCECTGGTAPNDKNPLCCTTPCEVVDVCMQPTAAMCKEENDCCGFGECMIDQDGDAYCECQYAYRMDQYDRTCCVRTGEPLESGQVCSGGTDCKTNFCLIYSGDETGYCSKRDCATNSECRNFSDDGNAMCCEDFGGENFVCFKLGSGCNCGDSSGGCGASCACQSESACGANFVCLASSAAGLDDPNAYCSMQCNTHEDCNQCEDPENPGTTFSCDAIGGGQKYCQPQRDEGCTRSGDCTGTEVCVPFPSDDMTDLIGMCATLGELETGAECDGNADPNNLPSSERCAGFYCLNSHCSEICEFDADCPEGMRCGTIGFRMDEEGINVAYVGMCMWFGGSMAPCAGFSDCPAGEICNFYVNSSDEVVTLCVTENCERGSEGCSPPGTAACGDEGADPCWGDLCLVYTTGESFCSLVCGNNEDCTTGTICGGLLGVTDDLTVPICVEFAGSAEPCMADADCPDGEACSFISGMEGFEAICMTPNDPGLPVGTECEGSQIPCYNDLCVGSDQTGWFCSSVCMEAADCPTGYYCGLVNLGDNKTWGACVPSEDGSADFCAKNADCPPGEACFYNETPFGFLEAFCLQAHTPGAAPGEACGGGTRCANDLCMADSTCSAVCDSNAVCTTYSRDCVWTNRFPNVATNLYGPACIAPDASTPLCTLCITDADCGGDSKCIESAANAGEKYCGLPCPNGDECGGLAHPMGPFSCTDVGGTVNNCKPNGDTCAP
jgi:hypothetical protein